MATDSYSQHKEDILLSEFFKEKIGFYVEVGAFDGVTLSNTYLFEKIGWRGILIEAIPELAKQAKNMRPASIVENYACVSPNDEGPIEFEILENDKALSSRLIENKKVEVRGKENLKKIIVPGLPLDKILEKNNVSSIDFITIDVEGFEFDVLRGFSVDRWKPQLIILESNHLFPENNILNYMFSHNYRYLRSTGVNDWYLLDEKMVKIKIWHITKSCLKIYLKSFKNILFKIYNRLKKIILNK